VEIFLGDPVLAVVECAPDFSAKWDKFQQNQSLVFCLRWPIACVRPLSGSPKPSGGTIPVWWQQIWI